MIEVLFLLFVVLYFVPTIVAIAREHHYVWIIFILNLLGFSVVTWIISFIWAAWPKRTAFWSPLVGDPTSGDPNDTKTIYSGIGRNVVTIRQSSKSPQETLLEYHKLLEKGIISQDQFETRKKLIVGEKTTREIDI